MSTNTSKASPLLPEGEPLTGEKDKPHLPARMALPQHSIEPAHTLITPVPEPSRRSFYFLPFLITNNRPSDRFGDRSRYPPPPTKQRGERFVHHRSHYHTSLFIGRLGFSPSCAHSRVCRVAPSALSIIYKYIHKYMYMYIYIYIFA